MKVENVTEKIKEIFGKMIPKGMWLRAAKGCFIKERAIAFMRAQKFLMTRYLQLRWHKNALSYRIFQTNL